MDRNTGIAMVLIFGLVMAWMYLTMPSPEELRQQQLQQRTRDSLAYVQDKLQAQDQQERFVADDEDQDSSKEKVATHGLFASSATDTMFTVVENELYRAVFSNVGAGPVEMILKRYNTWDDQPVQLLADTTKSAYSLGFVSSELLNVETRGLVFTNDSGVRSINVDENNQTLRYSLPTENGTLRFTYEFFPDRYEFDVEIDLSEVRSSVGGGKVDFIWRPRLRSTEKSKVQDGMGSATALFAGGELEKITMTEAGRYDNIVSGQIDWVASKTKFFTQIIKSVDPTDSGILVGEVNGDPSSEITNHYYSAGITSPIPEDGLLDFRLYVGPIRYNALADFEASTFEMVDLGYSIFRWFSEPLAKYLFIQYLDWLGPIIGNYGIAIILLAVLIKLVLSPLTKKSFESMAAMRQLQPELKLIQEKYKSDPQKQQEATMKLYKKAKVNPLGGCLPNLLQLPILVTLWAYFQNSIEIRQKEFLWVSDLSAPDFIFTLPFDIPFLGAGIGGFCILMTISMVGQMKISGQSGAANPQMQMFQYIMPVMMFFIFNSFSAGLNLYYLIYNVLSMGHQMLINKDLDHEGLMASIEGTKEKKRFGRKKK